MIDLRWTSRAAVCLLFLSAHGQAQKPPADNAADAAANATRLTMPTQEVHGTAPTAGIVILGR